jgi:hypothetical protein
VGCAFWKLTSHGGERLSRAEGAGQVCTGSAAGDQLERLLAWRHTERSALQISAVCCAQIPDSSPISMSEVSLAVRPAAESPLPVHPAPCLSSLTHTAQEGWRKCPRHTVWPQIARDRDTLPHVLRAGHVSPWSSLREASGRHLFIPVRSCD